MNISELSINTRVASYLQRNGITELTPIQGQVIPYLLSHEKDLHGQAQTGTGKTLAFLLPLIERLIGGHTGKKGLIISPTRELALQIAEVAKPLAKEVGLSVATIYGGVSIEDQIKKLKQGVDIVIGTPGRIRDHLSRKTLHLRDLQTLVLDEADIMLDMGFREEIQEILGYAPSQREIWLFSATVKEGIDYIKDAYMHDPSVFSVKQQTVTSDLTSQYFCVVPQKARVRAICRFIEMASDFYGLIFCQTKLLTQEVAERLNRYGYRVGALHGDMSQSQRNVVIRKFKERKLRVLVATDVAARGIDIQELTHVINYSFPEDHESYVHRVGRTGRAGKEGTAITFIEKKEISLVRRVQKKFKVNIEPIDVPSTEDLITQRVTHIRSNIRPDSKQGDTCKPLEELVSDLTQEEMRNALYNVLYREYIEPLAQESIPSMSVEQIKTEFATQEISLSVGSLDSVTRDQIKAHVLSRAKISEKQLKKIRVIQRKTFIEVPADQAKAVKSALEKTRLAGRSLRVDFVD